MVDCVPPLCAQVGHAFPERVVDPISISGLPPDAPELRLAVMLDEYSQSAAGGSRARFLFANLQQRLFSSIAAFHRTLTTHRRSLARKSEEIDPAAGETSPELIEDNDSIEIATHHAKGELGDLKAAMAHVDRMLAISGAARDLPDARVEAILDWIEDEMLDDGHAWLDRRLILFTEWEETRAHLCPSQRPAKPPRSSSWMTLCALAFRPRAVFLSVWLTRLRNQ